MDLKSRIVIAVEGRFDIDNPGLLSSEFAEAWQIAFDDVLRFFGSRGAASLSIKDSDWRTAKDIKLAAIRAHGLKPTKPIVDYCSLALFDKRALYYIDEQVSQSTIYDHFGKTEQIRILLVYVGDAGESSLQHDLHGCTFFFRSHEGDRHNTPHIHVKHGDDTCSISLTEPVKVLKGNLQGKVRRKALRLVEENRCLLLDEWNRKTDGIRLSVDESIAFQEVLSSGNFWRS